MKHVYQTNKSLSNAHLIICLFLLIIVILFSGNVRAEDDDALFIDEKGNVGIGTNNPEATLDVNGNLKVQGEVNGDLNVSGTAKASKFEGDGSSLYVDGNGSSLKEALNKKFDKAGGDVGSLTINGNLNVTGQQNIIKVKTFTKVVMNGNNDKPTQWTIDYSKAGFTEVLVAFTVLNGFSLYDNKNNLKFDHWDHHQHKGSIPQHVYVRLKKFNKTSATGEAFCSESNKDWEKNNAVLFTLVVIGR